jgi:tRNA(Ile)-lysidine synthase
MHFKIQKLLSEYHIDLTKHRILLAVSGGMDSVVLVELMHRLGIDFGIAHCNFQLRGQESSDDESFVRMLAERYQTPFFSVRFDTAEYVATHKVSIQVAARELRYKWLEEIRQSNKYSYLATAHHLNDNIETVLMNFIKGTGIRGLRGMQVRNGHLIRPMLSLSRAEIETYQKDMGLIFREDSSNASDKYTRNKIRHHLIPQIIDINPGFESGFADRLKVLGDIEHLYDTKIRKINKQLFEKREGDTYIPIRLLRKLPSRRSILFEYLQPLGFNAQQIDDILMTLTAESGRQFLSPQARIIKDRRFLIVTPLAIGSFTSLYIYKDDTEVKLNDSKIDITIKDNKDLTIRKEKAYAYLDLSKLEFPLMIRQWRKGDYFYPFGMKLKKKKVSKYFKDQKVPLHEKNKIWILESGQKIVWIVGERIDERYRVTESSTQVLALKLKNS